MTRPWRINANNVRKLTTRHRTDKRTGFCCTIIKTMVRFQYRVTSLAFIFNIICAQTLEKVCEQRLIYNGAGFIPHPTDCDKFIQCYFNSEGVLQGVVRQCAFSTYWDDESLTCGTVKDKACLTDKCLNESNGFTYKGENNCRGYWRCEDGRSVPMCCPPGRRYINDSVGCIGSQSYECVEICFNDIPNPEPEPYQETKYCDKQVAFGNRHAFVVTVGGLFTKIMSCPAGTRFDINECGCVYDYETYSRKKECKPEVHLTFDTNEMDQSGNGNHVFNQNVMIENGVARFNGVNSRLIIPRFSNIEHTDSVVIKVKYTSSHTKSKLTHAIVSNSDCRNVPSIMLCEDDVNTYYGVSTTRNQFAYTHLPQQETRWDQVTEKELVYKFADGKLVGKDGYNTTTTPASGHLRNVHCAIHVGYAEVLAPFEGEIDDLQIFLCNPNNV